MIKRWLLKVDTGLVAAFGFLGVLGFFFDALQPLVVLFLLPLLAPVIRNWQKKHEPVNAGLPAADVHTLFPDNGPAAKAGGDLGPFYVSILLAHANPLQLWQMLMQASGQMIIALRHRGGLPAHGTYRLKTQYALPVRGAWRVVNGGPTRDTSHSWDVLTQRYAYDLVITDERLRRHDPAASGESLQDYFCYGRDIVAAADGEVVSVVEGVRDFPRPGTLAVDWQARDFRGNHVIVRHAPGEYGFYAHLIPGSVAVKPGQRIVRGQIIGRCGNSGHSTEPHLHFHLQDHASMWIAAGLPIVFEGVGAPVAGQVVEG